MRRPDALPAPGVVSPRARGSPRPTPFDPNVPAPELVRRSHTCRPAGPMACRRPPSSRVSRAAGEPTPAPPTVPPSQAPVRAPRVCSRPGAEAEAAEQLGLEAEQGAGAIGRAQGALGERAAAARLVPRGLSGAE